MDRRTLLQLTSAVGINAAATAAFAASFTDLDDALTERAHTNADQWQSTTWEYAQKIWVAPPGALIGDLASDVMALGAALKREGRPQVRRELLRAGSEICTYMAQEFGDLGDPRQARRCFWRATRAADLSGDRALATWVRTYHAKRMIWENRPPEAIAHLVDNTIDSAGRKPDIGLLRAWRAKAEFLADRGDAAGAETALNTLRDGFTTLTTDEISARGWPEGHLRFTEAFVYSQLGSVRHAHTAIDTALRLVPVQRAGGRANLKLMRALTLVHEREVNEGLEYAVTTAQSASPTLARQRMAEKIVKALPDDRARAHPDVQQLRTLTTPAPPDPA